MSAPRQVLPGTFYMITRRCTQRQFLLRPDEATNNAFLYCLAHAAQRSGVEVILPVVMSNHHHTIVFDRRGTIVEFTEHLHKLVAKSQNALRGRWENFWSSEPPCLVRLVDAADVLAKLAYAATNPVKDHLVERVHHWPGFHGLRALLHDLPLTAHRPRHFFRPDGDMRATLTLHLLIPPELGNPDQLRTQLRDLIAAIERRAGEHRRRTGQAIVGRRAILSQSWRAHPSTPEPRRDLQPRVAARSVWSRIEALLRNRAFADAYRDARLRWRAGLPALFPIGTYWLRRFANIAIAEQT